VRLVLSLSLPPLSFFNFTLFSLVLLFATCCLAEKELSQAFSNACCFLFYSYLYSRISPTPDFQVLEKDTTLTYLALQMEESTHLF